MSKNLDVLFAYVKIIAQICNIVIKLMQQSYIINMTNKTKITYSFDLGMQKITLRDQKCVKLAIYEVLGIKNRHDFCRKKHGILNIPKHQYDAITAIFERYGVAEKDVWIVQ